MDIQAKIMENKSITDISVNILDSIIIRPSGGSSIR
jgi:hypothetical protein